MPDCYEETIRWEYLDVATRQKKEKIILTKGQNPRVLSSKFTFSKKNTIKTMYNNNLILYFEANDEAMLIKKRLNDINRYKNKYEELISLKEEHREKIYEENSKKTTDNTQKIQKLKATIEEKEELFKESVTSLMRKNNELKEEFEEYDRLKDRYLDDYIGTIREKQTEEVAKLSFKKNVRQP